MGCLSVVRARVMCQEWVATDSGIGHEEHRWDCEQWVQNGLTNGMMGGSGVMCLKCEGVGSMTHKAPCKFALSRRIFSDGRMNRIPLIRKVRSTNGSPIGGDCMEGRVLERLLGGSAARKLARWARGRRRELRMKIICETMPPARNIAIGVLQFDLVVGRAQVDRLSFEIVLAGEITHGAALDAHQHRVCDSNGAVYLDAAQEWTVADAGCGEQDFVAAREVLRAKSC